MNDAGAGRRKWPNRPLMEDVARLAGVSSSTVSRALNGPAGLVSKEAVARVAAAAEALSYVPNMMAGSLAAASSRSVGIVVPTLNNSVFAVMLDELTTVLMARGYQTMIANCGYSEEREEALVNSVSGLVPGCHCADRVASLAGHDTPPGQGRCAGCGSRRVLAARNRQCVGSRTTRSAARSRGTSSSRE